MAFSALCCTYIKIGMKKHSFAAVNQCLSSMARHTSRLENNRYLIPKQLQLLFAKNLTVRSSGTGDRTQDYSKSNPRKQNHQAVLRNPRIREKSSCDRLTWCYVRDAISVSVSLYQAKHIYLARIPSVAKPAGNSIVS